MIPDRMTPERMARLMELVADVGDLALEVAAQHLRAEVGDVARWMEFAEICGLKAWPGRYGAVGAPVEVSRMAGVAL